MAQLNISNIKIKVANWDPDASDWEAFAEQSQLTLVRFDRSRIRPQTATVVDHTIRHDAAGVVTNNAKIQISDDDWATIFFEGVVRVIDPQGITNEGIEYLVVDERWLLEKEVFARINGSYQYSWNDQGHSDHSAPGWGNLNFWTVGEIIIDLLEHALGTPPAGSDIPSHHHTRAGGTPVTDTYLTVADIASYDAADILEMDAEIDMFDINGTFLGAAITDLLEIQREVSWYIDPVTKAFTLVKHTDAVALNVQAGAVDNHVSKAGTNYVLMDDPMQFSLDGVYTRCILQGMPKISEAKPPNIVDPASIDPAAVDDSLLCKAWDTTLEGAWSQAAFDAGNYTGDDTYEWVYRRFRSRQPHRLSWAPGIVNASPFCWSGMLFYNSSGSNYSRVRNSNAGLYVTYLSLGTVIFTEPLAVAYRNLQYADWYMYYEPFVVDVGPSGTAYTNYGYEGTMVIVDESFQHATSLWPYVAGTTYFGVEVRDDTGRMTALANRILGVTSDEKVSGEWQVDGIDLSTYALNKKLNLTNLAQWSSMGLYLFHVDCDVANDSMKLSVANRIDAVSINGISMFQSNLLRFRRENALRSFRRQLQILRRASVGLAYGGI